VAAPSSFPLAMTAAGREGGVYAALLAARTDAYAT
jgi:hypothetical protein